MKFTPIEALKAIRARVQGEWDDPNLRKFGVLYPDSQADVLNIADAGLAKESKDPPNDYETRPAFFSNNF